MRVLGLTIAVAACLGLPLGAQVLVQVTKNGSGLYDQYPVISEDGSIIAWCGTDPATRKNQVWIADNRTFTPQRLTNGNGLPIPYPIGISGDGATIVYMESNNLWAIPTVGGTPRQITNYTGNKQVRNYGITMTRDGTLACYTTYDSGTKIYDVEVVNTTTKAVVNITKNTTSDFCTGGISGDGKTVAFTQNRGSPADQVWLANADGSNIRQLTKLSSGNAFYPKLDHLGSIVAFESSQSGRYEIYTAFTRNGFLTSISLNPTHDDRRPMMATDGDRVTWKSDRGSARDVYMAFPDGSGQRQVTPFGDLQPSLTNSSHALNGDGTIAVFATPNNYQGGNPEGDYEIWYWRDALTRSGPATPGSTVALLMEDPSRPAATYLVRCAFGRSPGLFLPGVGTVPLNPDTLFWLSGLVPTIFKNFQGVLNANGQATAAVALPNTPVLSGLVFYASFVTASPALKVYNPLKITIL
jgi:Tol biopolymer transport system component